MLVLECTEDNIATAAESVRKGRVVVYPTDTVYGIGCDPYNDSAVELIFGIKGREEGKPLPLLCSSAEVAAKIVKLNESARMLAAKFWPGPLTIVVELADKRIAKNVTAGMGLLGVRVPDHRCALSLIERCGGVIVGTSANRSGARPPRSAQEVSESLQGFDILLDGGSTPLGVESTVVDLSGAEPRIVREGYVTRAQIESVLADV